MKYRVLQLFWSVIIFASASLVSFKIIPEQYDVYQSIALAILIVFAIGALIFALCLAIEIIATWATGEYCSPALCFAYSIFCFPLYIQKRMERKEIEKAEEIKLVNKTLYENGIVDKNGKIV